MQTPKSKHVRKGEALIKEYAPLTLVEEENKTAMIEMKNKETPFCESAQRTESYVTGEQKGVDDVIRSIIT